MAAFDGHIAALAQEPVVVIQCVFHPCELLRQGKKGVDDTLDETMLANLGRIYRHVGQHPAVRFCTAHEAAEIYGRRSTTGSP